MVAAMVQEENVNVPKLFIFHVNNGLMYDSYQDWKIIAESEQEAAELFVQLVYPRRWQEVTWMFEVRSPQTYDEPERCLVIGDFAYPFYAIGPVKKGVY